MVVRREYYTVRYGAFEDRKRVSRKVEGILGRLFELDGLGEIFSYPSSSGRIYFFEEGENVDGVSVEHRIGLQPRLVARANRNVELKNISIRFGLGL